MLFIVVVFLSITNGRPYMSGANKAITMTWKNWFPKYLNSYFSKLSCRLSDLLSSFIFWNSTQEYKRRYLIQCTRRVTGKTFIGYTERQYNEKQKTNIPHCRNNSKIIHHIHRKRQNSLHTNTRPVTLLAGIGRQFNKIGKASNYVFREPEE